MFTKTKLIVFLMLGLLAVTLAACGGQDKPQFSAPEIDPPQGLIPAYVPEGFELVSGYEIEVGAYQSRFLGSDSAGRVACDIHFDDLFFDLKSPAGNSITGIYYRGDDQLLLISQSYFPDGSLEIWQENYEGTYAEECDCDCDCLQIEVSMPFPLRAAQFQEVRTIGETQVAILESWAGWTTVFVRGDHLITVESEISLEENLKIVESLLQ